MEFYKVSGLVGSFLSEMTTYDNSQYLFHANELGFEHLKELAIDCIDAMENTKSWCFLTNGKLI